MITGKDAVSCHEFIGEVAGGVAWLVDTPNTGRVVRRWEVERIIITEWST